MALDANVSFLYRRAFIGAVLFASKPDASRKVSGLHNTSLIGFILLLIIWPGIRGFIERSLGFSLWIGLVLNLAVSTGFYLVSRQFDDSSDTKKLN